MAPTASWNFDASKISGTDIFDGILADDVRVYIESLYLHGQVLLTASVCTSLTACLPGQTKQVQQPQLAPKRPGRKQCGSH
eukprot:6487582-Amphidinium_carterae.2